MANKNTYYDCKCKHYDGGLILCRPCKGWLDKVDKAIEEHKVDEHTTVTKTKRWVNSKLNRNKS